jgi:chaperone required for assembly of F1-ATPase
MRDLFDMPSEHAIEAARRGARGVLQRRFYDTVTAATAANGFAVQLDGKPVRTPARRVLAAPTVALADALAAEWQAQRDVIDPAKMPLTRLANAIIDGVADTPQPLIEEIGKYLSSDLLFYRASDPQELSARQARQWDPILAWAREAFAADFKSVQGVTHLAQPAAALAAARAAIPDDPWRLGAAHAATTLTGSALLALAIASGRLSADEAWAAANVDEDWNLEQWGRDVAALERRAFRFAELQAAATVLRALR